MDPVALRLANLLRPEQFPYERKTGWVYDSGDYERGAAQGARARRLRRAAPRAGAQARARRADGHRRPLLHRGGRRRAAQAHGHHGAGHERRRGAAHVAHRHGAARRSACRRRARATRRRSRRSSPRSSGIPPEDVEVDPRRHRHDAIRARHLRLALDAGQRRGDRARRPQGARARADRRLGDARGRAGGPRVDEGAAARWAVVGDPEQARHDPRDRDGGARRDRAARRDRGGARRRGGLRPAEPDVPVRRLRVRRRRRPGDRRGHGPPVRRRRRLRHAHQPDDRRGPDPRWADGRRRDGADGDDRVRRGGQLPGRVADGLPDPDRGRGARLGDRLHGHAVAAPPARCEGDRRVGDRRLAARDRQRDLRRARAVRRPPRRHAVHTLPGLGSDARKGRPPR